jgi:hypothetical protein
MARNSRVRPKSKNKKNIQMSGAERRKYKVTIYNHPIEKVVKLESTMSSSEWLSAMRERGLTPPRKGFTPVIGKDLFDGEPEDVIIKAEYNNFMI